MTKIERWNAAFAAMDDRARDELLLMAEAAARAHPRRNERRLALVVSNVIAGPGQRFGKAEDVGAATLVGAVKQLQETHGLA